MAQPVLPEEIPKENHKAAGPGYGICPKYDSDIPEKRTAVKIHATLSPHQKVIIITMESRERPAPLSTPPIPWEKASIKYPMDTLLAIRVPYDTTSGSELNSLIRYGAQNKS